MARSAALFEYGGQWIDREAGRPSFYRYWNEHGRVRRRALGTGDLEEAKRRLVEIIHRENPTEGAPESVLLAAVARHYIDQRYLSKRTDPDKVGKTEREARRAWRSVIDQFGTESRVAEFDLIGQRKFIRQLHADGLNAKSIANAMSYIAAGMHFAAKDQIITTQGGEKVVRMLDRDPTVMSGHREIADFLEVSIARAERWLPTTTEVAALINAIRPQHDHLFRFIVLALNTWARPSTILDLDVEDQVDTRHGFVDLLPKARRQTKKWRPIIPLTKNLSAWLAVWKARYPVMWRGAPIEEINDAFRSTARGIGMHEFTPYTLRHFMATQAMIRGVPKEERSIYLGHLFREGSETTRHYEHFAPDYLDHARRVTDEIITEIDGQCRRPLWPQRRAQKLALVASRTA